MQHRDRFLLHNDNICGVAIYMAFGALLLSTIGCRGESRLTVAPVHGRVTYRGQGIPKAIVIFWPTADVVDQAKKMRPFAYADDQGNFDLKTYVDGDGAPLGKYRVSIVAIAAPSGPIPPDINKKYSSVDTAGIEVTVQAGDNNLPPFDLKSATGG